MSFELLIKIINSKGYIIREQLNSIDTLSYFLEMNLQEFDASVNQCIEGEDLWYEKNAQDLEFHMLEIERRCHNYITAFYSLLGCTRRFRDKLKDNSFFIEYENEKNKYFENVESLLIRNLREYFQHYDIPPIMVVIKEQFFGYERDKKNIFLDSGKLLKYERLNAELKKYLSENNIDLVSLLHKHNSRLRKFYKWFNSYIYGKYAKELEALQQYEKEYRENIQHQP